MEEGAKATPLGLAAERPCGGFGVPCWEAQADGFPCYEVGARCGLCGRVRSPRGRPSGEGEWGWIRHADA